MSISDGPNAGIKKASIRRRRAPLDAGEDVAKTRLVRVRGWRSEYLHARASLHTAYS